MAHFIASPILCRLNAAEMFVDVGKTDAATFTNWVAESGVLDLFLLLGPTPARVSEFFAFQNSILEPKGNLRANERNDALMLHFRCPSNTLRSQAQRLCPSTFPWGTTSVAGITGMRRTCARWMPISTNLTSPMMSFGWTLSTLTGRGTRTSACLSVILPCTLKLSELHFFLNGSSAQGLYEKAV